MTSVLSKPSDQIDVADIQELIDSQVPEGQQIEFKADSRRDGDSSEPWISGGRPIRERARNRILEEVVAFANAYGGAVVLGIAESESKPPVAARICPIHRCADLVEQLKHKFRDCVDPQIPSLEIVAVRTDGDDGVVVIRVGRSRMAPHRVEPTRHCTTRRSDRCERMSMREIQDLTLNLSRGSERIERRFAERAKSFSQEFQRLEDARTGFGFRVTGMPVVEHIKFDHIYGFEAVYRPPLRISFFGMPGPAPARSPSPTWRPNLRAARSEYSTIFDGKTCTEYEYEEVHYDGLVECAMVSSGSGFETAIPVRYFAIAAFWSDIVRRVAGAPSLEYILEFEMCIKGKYLPVQLGYRYRNTNNLVWFNRHDMEVGKLRQSPVKFPRYSLAESSDLARLVAIFERDFWNSIGVDFGLNEDAFLIEEFRSDATL